MLIKIVNKSYNELPAYSTEMSAGMDLRASLKEPVVLKPLERKLIPTGLYIELPQGYEAQIRPPDLDGTHRRSDPRRQRQGGRSPIDRCRHYRP